MKNKVCAVTGSRAEFGILRPLLTELRSDPYFKLQLIACGAHLSPQFGLSYREIESAGFRIDEKVRIPLGGDTESAMIKSIAAGLPGFTRAFLRLKPDLVVLLGDRFEIFSAAIAAFLLRLPIAHIHGGEVTQGAADEAFRHAITKMSYLHFTSTGDYRRRVIQLGESPERVFNVGALGIANIRSLKLLEKREVEKSLNFKFGAKNILVTFHPVTLEDNTAKRQFNQLQKAIASFPGLKTIFTLPNADAHSRQIIRLINAYCRRNRASAVSIASMGTQMYFSAIRFVDAVAGNSSSGIIEVPSFGVPTVNIGDRQKGRVRPPSVIDCLPETASIRRALLKAFSADFKSACRKSKNPYDGGEPAKRIAVILKKRINKITDLKKPFYDLRINQYV